MSKFFQGNALGKSVDKLRVMQYNNIVLYFLDYKIYKLKKKIKNNLNTKNLISINFILYCILDKKFKERNLYNVTILYKEKEKMEDIIKKVNEFSRLARERELTEEEKKEREKYRKMYIEKFKESVRGHLDSIKVVRVDDDGNPIDDDGNVIEPEA